MANTNYLSSDSKPPLPPKSKAKVVKKKSRQLFEVWDHFTKNQDDLSNPGAVCNYYGKDYASDNRKNGTSTLWNHVNNQCKKNPYRLEDKKQKILRFQKISDMRMEVSQVVIF